MGQEEAAKGAGMTELTLAAVRGVRLTHARKHALTPEHLSTLWGESSPLCEPCCSVQKGRARGEHDQGGEGGSGRP